MNLVFVFVFRNMDIFSPVLITVNSKSDFLKLYKAMYNKDLNLVNIINMG